MRKKTIAVLVPCYNEALTIEKVVKDYKAAIPEATIYVYDNNSKDGTDEIARKAGAVVRYEKQQGKGNVVRTMFREIDADCYLMIDGDDTYPAEKAMEMCKRVLDKNVDMVIGDRLSSTYFTENKRFGHNFGNVLVRLLVNLFFGGNFRDIMTGMRAMSYNFVKSFPVVSKGFEIETEMAIHTLYYNMSHDSVTIEYRDRPEGSVSKLNTIRDGFKVLLKIMFSILQFKPLVFFGICAVVSFVGWLLSLNSEMIINRIFGLLTLGCLFSGLVGYIIERNNRQSFEISLNKIVMMRGRND